MALRKRAWHFLWLRDVRLKQLTNNLSRPVGGLHHLRMPVQISQQKSFERLRCVFHLCAELQQRRAQTGFVCAMRCMLLQCGLGCTDHIKYLLTQHAANGFVQQTPAIDGFIIRGQMRKCFQGLLLMPRKQRHILQLLQTQQTRTHTVIDIVCVVGDGVRQIAQLRFQTGLGAL